MSVVQTKGGAIVRLGGHAPKIKKKYFILCLSIKNLYLATKIEVGSPKCLS